MDYQYQTNHLIIANASPQNTIDKQKIIVGFFFSISIISTITSIVAITSSRIPGPKSDT